MKTIKHLSKITIALFLLTLTTHAQEFKRKGFDVTTGIPTGQTLTIENKTFPILATPKGSNYLKLLSPKTKNYYPLWIGTKVDTLFEGSNVYISKKGSYCIYKLSPNTGNPYAVWLTKSK